MQSTFYKLPRVSTAEKWRREAPEGFEYTAKAWQPMTHPPTSPTWRKAKLKLLGSPDAYGHLKPTRENLEAWDEAREVYKAMGCRIVVFQCPPTFKMTEQSIRDMREFFQAIAGELKLAWEPRHESWHSSPSIVEKLCTDLELIHVTDILKRPPRDPSPVLYTRLHGLGREIDYSYKYTVQDLRKLISLVEAYSEYKREAYIMFNNIRMWDDALKLLELLSSR